MEVYASAVYALVICWAVGIGITVVASDTETGMIRDFPVFGRQLSSRVVPPLVIIGLVVPFMLGVGFGDLPPRWILLSIPAMLPFAFLSRRWSQAFIIRTPAHERRRRGYWALGAGIAGNVASSLLAIVDLHPAWRLVVPMFMFASTTTLTGSLTNFSLMAVTAGLPVEVPGGPAEAPSGVTGFGFLANALLLATIGGSWLGSATRWPSQAIALIGAWVILGMVVPGAILLLRLKWRGMPDASFLSLALGAALTGQWLGLVLIFKFPGLVPLQYLP